jgi:hypothetical protein
MSPAGFLLETQQARAPGRRHHLGVGCGAVYNPTRRFFMPLRIGDRAPDFKLASATADKQGDFQLSAHQGKNVVIYFYALDFTPV